MTVVVFERILVHLPEKHFLLKAHVLVIFSQLAGKLYSGTRYKDLHADGRNCLSQQSIKVLRTTTIAGQGSGDREVFSSQKVPR